MCQAYDLAAKRSEKSRQHNKSTNDKTACSTALQPGDRVLVRNLSERGGPGKLRSLWEKQIHRVVKQVGDYIVRNVVFRVKSRPNNTI